MGVITKRKKTLNIKVQTVNHSNRVDLRIMRITFIFPKKTHKTFSRIFLTKFWAPGTAKLTDKLIYFRFPYWRSRLLGCWTRNKSLKKRVIVQCVMCTLKTSERSFDTFQLSVFPFLVFLMFTGFAPVYLHRIRNLLTKNTSNTI